MFLIMKLKSMILIKKMSTKNSKINSKKDSKQTKI